MVLIRILLLRRQRQKQKMRIFLKILMKIFLQQQRPNHRPLSTTSTDTHNLHEHPLILYNLPNAGGGEVPCDGCLLPLSGDAYICMQCKFILHKPCAKLPETIIHFLHPKHPITLFPKTPYHGPPTCDNCDERIWGFGYHCSVCQFNLDIKCVLLQQIVEHEGHEHSFKLLRPTSFTCDACGDMSDDDTSYICSTCHLWVHKTCASLPPTIKHIGHDHPLSLIHSIQLNDPMDSLCKTCGKDVDTCYWCYYCASCTYIVHLDCAATFESKLDDECNELGSAFQSSTFIDGCINGCTVDDVNEVSLTKIERVTELQHYSHQHSLTLSDDEPEREEICDGCVQTISAPFYSCAQCIFFLHVSCTELPLNILHLLHPHLLTLFTIQSKQSAYFSLFGCGACRQFSNGFAYVCKICRFYIDLKCASVSGALRHEAHEHTLSLNQKVSKSVCNACGVRCHTKFRCEACDFDLDLRCAALPSSARHEWDKHPLKLTFSIIEDKLGTYYCDFCEERKDDPNHWFYYCEDCDVVVHPTCLLGTHTMVKFGRSHETVNCPHLLTLVKNTRLPHRSGHYCDHKIHEDKNMFLLECADCNVHEHC